MHQDVLWPHCELLPLGPRDRRALRALERDGNIPQKLAKRARIVLMTADGHGTMAIMRTVGVAKTTVWRWQEYFVTAGVPGLVKGRSKPPGKKPIAEDISRLSTGPSPACP